MRTLKITVLIAGVITMALAYPMFFLENNIAPGGLSGIAMMLNHLWGFPVGLSTFIMNLPLFALGYRQRGHAFILRSFAAMTAVSFLIDWLPVPTLTFDPLLAALGGGVLLGLGLGLVLRADATTGGTDMAAALLHRRFPILSIGGILLAIDCIVILGAGIVFEPQAALYALVALYVSTRVMDTVVVGFDTARAFYIISDQHTEIARRILDELSRGATILNGHGAYSGKERNVLLCVVKRLQVPQLKRIVASVDPTAFMIVTHAHEVIGEGFLGLGED